MGSYKHVSFNPFLNDANTLNIGNDFEPAAFFDETIFEKINAECYIIMLK